jgi:hypothetical protein
MLFSRKRTAGEVFAPFPQFFTSPPHTQAGSREAQAWIGFFLNEALGKYKSRVPTFPAKAPTQSVRVASWEDKL